MVYVGYETGRAFGVILDVVIWLVLIVALFVVAALTSDGASCPSCGLELVDSPLDGLGDDDRLDHCRHCGWRRRR